MVERETIPTAYKDCDISVVTEQLPNQQWAVVVTVTHGTEQVQRITPLPVHKETFPSQDLARDFGVETGRRWIDENTPAAGPR
jgi:hypothetical protein